MLLQINWPDVIGKVIAGLIVAAILAIISWAKSPRFRLLLKRLWNTVIEWLRRQWRYIVVISILLTPIYVVLYLVYASWWIIAFSIVHLALFLFAVPPLFASKRPWTTGGLIQKIDFVSGVTDGINWQHIGHADNIVAMTAIHGKLFAATQDNKLWMREPVASDISWQHIGHADNIVALATINGKLFAATKDDQLLMGDLSALMAQRG